MNTPFLCSQTAYQIAGNPSKLYKLDLVTGAMEPVGDNGGVLEPNGGYNAAGYNPIDDCIYIYNYQNHSIYRIYSDATTELVGAIPNLPQEIFFCGAFDDNGYFYVCGDEEHTIYVIDLNSTRATYLQMVDPRTGYLPTTEGIAMGYEYLYDWAFNPIDKQLYTIETLSGQVARVDFLTGQVEKFTTTGLPVSPPAVTFGALFYDDRGTLYAFHNEGGVIYKIDIDNNTANATIFSRCVPTAFNDGTRCMNARLDLLSVNHTVDQPYAKPGDIVTYTTQITNLSEVNEVTGVEFSAPIPSGTSFVAGSYKVDGVVQSGTPSDGTVIGIISASGEVEIAFEVTITDISPQPTPITDVATVSYSQGWPIESDPAETVIITESSTKATLLSLPDLIISISAANIVWTDKLPLEYTITVTNHSGLPINLMSGDLYNLYTTAFPEEITIDPASISVSDNTLGNFDVTSEGALMLELTDPIMAGTPTVITFEVNKSDEIDPSQIITTSAAVLHQNVEKPSNTVIVNLKFNPQPLPTPSDKKWRITGQSERSMKPQLYRLDPLKECCYCCQIKRKK